MRLLCNEVLRFDIDRKNLVNLFTLDLFQGAEVLDSGVAHDDINFSELFFRGLEKPSKAILA